MVERSADWIWQSRRDLEHARNDVASGYYEWACFSAQQAAEKAVKAVFQKLGAEAWGHSVAELVQELSQSQPSVQALVEPAAELDKAYIPTRYPNSLPAGRPGELYTRGEAERLVALADRIVGFCESLLSTL